MSSSEEEKKGSFYGSTESELKQFMVGLGHVKFDNNQIIFKNYPFENSIASINSIINAKDIINVNIKSAPPAIRVCNEIIFISAKHLQLLKKFTEHNKIPFYNRPDLWSWILDPFIDTELTEEHKERLYHLLEKYELHRETVDNLRESVKMQIMKYNYDTMIWDWIDLGALDVLKAMRPKLNSGEFDMFYKQVMEIAIRPDQIENFPSR